MESWKLNALRIWLEELKNSLERLKEKILSSIPEEEKQEVNTVDLLLYINYLSDFIYRFVTNAELEPEIKLLVDEIYRKLEVVKELTPITVRKTVKKKEAVAM